MNDRIVSRAKELGLNQTDIIKLTTASKGTVSKWFNAVSKPSGDNLVVLAKALQTTTEWLSKGTQSGVSKSVSKPQADYNAEILPPSNKVPVIDLVAAGNWTETCDPYPVGEAENWEECPAKHGENTFAVRINGESMMPKFEHGEIIFCDPSQQPENKDFVIAKLTDENQATFKQLILEGGNMMLKALNPNWPNQYIPINGNCQIVGKVIARLEKF